MVTDGWTNVQNRPIINYLAVTPDGVSDGNAVCLFIQSLVVRAVGMVTSACLPIVADGEFQGVTCMDIPIDTMFSPIIDFHLGRLSYAFLVDSSGRVLLHPLLPKPRNYKLEPIFLDMENVEISEATVRIRASMIRFVAVYFCCGHQSTDYEFVSNYYFLNTRGGLVAEWLACLIQAQKGLGLNRSRDAVG